MTYLTVPIAAGNLDQAKQQIKTAKATGAEMLELRTDYLENLSADLVKNLIAEAKTVDPQPLPIIVTCRDARQGGAIGYPDQLRIDILTEALKAGAEFIDFEYENFLSAENQERIRRALSQASKGRLILSAHNFETKFPNIIKLHRHIQTLYPAAIPKLVYTANHINDCFEAFDLLRRTSG
jgi:3-dehydroquinate dehydratase/shikimate dehydrogenase